MAPVVPGHCRYKSMPRWLRWRPGTSREKIPVPLLLSGPAVRKAEILCTGTSNSMSVCQAWTQLGCALYDLAVPSQASPKLKLKHELVLQTPVDSSSLFQPMTRHSRNA